MNEIETCPCGFKSSNKDDFEFHEIAPGYWKPFCKSCVETLELDAGK